MKDYGKQFAGEKDLNYLRTVATLLSYENERLAKRVAELEKTEVTEPSAVQQELQILQEKLDRREHELFGKSSERRPAPEDAQPEAKPESTPKSETKRRGHGPREQRQLRVIEVVHKIPESERVCPHCGDHLELMQGQYETDRWRWTCPPRIASRGPWSGRCPSLAG